MKNIQSEGAKNLNVFYGKIIDLSITNFDLLKEGFERDLERIPGLLNYTDKDNKSLLSRAIAANKEDLVVYLLEKGAVITQSDIDMAKENENIKNALEKPKEARTDITVDNITVSKKLEKDDLNREVDKVAEQNLKIKTRDQLILEQKKLGEEIRDKTKTKSNVIYDMVLSIKNVFKSKDNKLESDRMRLRNKQKEIGREIRSSDASVIPKSIRSKLGMTKKDGGRVH